jgi:hypothetical protein
MDTAIACAKYEDFVAAGIAAGRRPELVGGGLLRSAGGWGQLNFSPGQVASPSDQLNFSPGQVASPHDQMNFSTSKLHLCR